MAIGASAPSARRASVASEKLSHRNQPAKSRRRYLKSPLSGYLWRLNAEPGPRLRFNDSLAALAIHWFKETAAVRNTSCR